MSNAQSHQAVLETPGALEHFVPHHEHLRGLDDSLRATGDGDELPHAQSPIPVELEADDDVDGGGGES